MNKDLTVGKPQQVLWRFCLPLLGSVVFQQLYNIADSLVAGRFAGEDALAAVGNSYEITLIYLAFAFGCNMGCSVVVSQFFGAKNYRDMKTAVYTTFIFSAIVCGILTLMGFLFGGSLLHLIHTPEHIFADSKLYLDIYTGGLIFLFFYNIATGIFSALGDSRTPFIFLAFSSVANVGVDILFVKVFRMGVAGVAWATFICQGISCILSMIVVIRRLASVTHTTETGNERVPLFSANIFKKIVSIAVPSTLQQSFVSVGNIVIQGIINSFGSSVMAGYAAAIKLNNMIITTYTAMGNGMSNFSGQNLGAGKPDRIKAGLKAGLRLVFCISVLIVTVYLVFSRGLVNLFMDSETNTALDIGVQFLHIVVPFYFVVSVKITCDGVLRGVGAMKQFMVSTFSDLILRVGLAFLFSSRWGVVGIWCAWPVGWLIGTILSVVFYLNLKKTLLRQSPA
ncbi:MAG: MATE family efflux transporter [Wujia sp.]